MDPGFAEISGEKSIMVTFEVRPVDFSETDQYFAEVHCSRVTIFIFVGKGEFKALSSR